MVVQTVKLTNFRSHKEFELNCKKNTTTIIGENGCGKTSVLEAIYEGLRGKSFRAVDKEMVRRGAEFYRIEIIYKDGRKIVVYYDGNKKEFLAEDKKTRRLPQRVRYPIVLFEPDDLHLVGASPVSRRNYFDQMFGQLDVGYGVALTRYNKALKQRNELLKKEGVREGELFAWDVMIAKYGVMLMEKRREYIMTMNQRVTDIYRSIAKNNDRVKLSYESMVETESNFLDQLSRNFERDVIVGHTVYGVHRDNYDFIFNEVKADGSASRGEVRSCVIALKFIEAEMIEKMLGQKPVVLLDDVFSELDQERQRSLVKNFQDHQVILTSVGEGKMVIN